MWNETGASFAFQIVPVFWRTWWFRTTLLFFGSLLIVGFHRLRVRQLTRQLNVGLEARVSERTRIARDLHDTLLQSFHGVLIHFQAATNLLPGRPDDAKRTFENAMDQATRAITEARDAVQALRAPDDASHDLAQAIRTLGEELVGEDKSTRPASVRVNVEGSPRSLHPTLREDVYRIAVEAVRNAMRHARAQVIQVDIHYDDRHLRLRIRDDGKGIDAKTLEGRAAAGHWGLQGMRERAELIGGTLDVRSSLGSGTEIGLSIPASNAYAAPAGRRRFLSGNDAPTRPRV
jgi:signal transduction histidine kinase